jgi:aspartyl protease family protein
MIIRLSSDGHFYINVKINNATIRFMIDTGASDMVINNADAIKIGVNVQKLHFDKRYNTANGVVLGASVRLQKVEIGNLKFTDVLASINNADMGTSLLGMSFLRKFKKYEFYQDRLVLSL